MKHLVCLLEEPSAQDALQVWLPQWLPAAVTPHFIVFQGKQDLEKQMVRRMRHWLMPESRFLVLRDQDSGDCKTVKRTLAAKCAEAGKPDALVRVACRELESFLWVTGKRWLLRLTVRHWAGWLPRPPTASPTTWVPPARSWPDTFPATRSATAPGASHPV